MMLKCQTKPGAKTAIFHRQKDIGGLHPIVGQGPIFWWDILDANVKKPELCAFVNRCLFLRSLGHKPLHAGAMDR